MSGLDISQCKKISQDNNSAVFHHPDGHEVKIALSGLSSAMRKKLDKLPVHKAEGDEIKSLDAPPKEEDLIASAEKDPDAASVPDLQQDPAASVPPPPAGGEVAAPASETPAEASAPQEAPAPQAAAPAPAAQPPMNAEQRAAQKTAENVAFADDLSSGKISAQHYSDYFANKSTLGKIGTIFGLMAAGAGSGLTGQPNAMLEMINKEIERDVEAQKADQSNRQNWYKLSLEHTKNTAENALTTAQAQGAAAQADWQKNLNTQAKISDMSASDLAANSATAVMLQERKNMIDRMPPGPQKTAAQNDYEGQTLSFFLNKAHGRNLATEGKIDVINAAKAIPVKGNPPPKKGPAIPGVRYDSYNKDEFAKRKAQGLLYGDKAGSVEGAIPREDAAKIEAEVPKLAANRATYADGVKSFYHLAGMNMAGEAPAIGIGTGILNTVGKIFHGESASAGGAGADLEKAFTKERNTQMESLITKMTTGTTSEAQARRAVESFMPSFNDTPRQRELKFEQLKNHFTTRLEDQAPVTQNYHLYYDPPNYQFKDKRDKKSFAPGESSATPAMGENKQ